MIIDRKTLLATTMVAGMVMAFPSFAAAQSQQTEDEDEQAQQTTEVEAVVVTGSRIRRDAFSSTQPVQIITAEEATLEGLVDTTEILQGSTVANTASQINNYFTGFVVDGGPGVNTLSLRGLGAQRTLVLLNGRRAGPAGARGNVGPFDLNVVPSSLWERVEILTDGASSIYGSDAVAGVVNIITRTNLDGGRASVYYNQPFDSGGEQFTANISHGWTFDRGYITLSADYYERKPLLFGDRDSFACPQDYYFRDEARLIRADIVDPSTGNYRCNSMGAELVSLYYDGGAWGASDFAPDPSAVTGGGPLGCDLNGWRHVRVFMTGHGDSCWLPATHASAPWQAANADEYNQLLRSYAGRSGIATHSDRYDSRTAVSPVRRTSLMAFAGYDLTPTTEVFGELLLNRRESSQNSWRQWWGVTTAAHPRNPFPATYFDPLLGGSLPITHIEPTLLLNSHDEQEVDYARGVAGIRGQLDFGRGWDWELVAQYSRSEAEYGGTFIYNDRVMAASEFFYDPDDNLLPMSVIQANVAAGCNPTFLTTAASCPAGGVDFFSPAVVGNGQFRAEDAAFLLGYEYGKTIYTHQYIEGVISGELFDLPAGPIGAALGFQIRREEINDQPGEQERTGNYWGSSDAQQTVGSDTISELFAEIELPIVRGQPLFNELTLNLSGRFSDYDSYGDNTTYKIGLNWALTPEWRIRASQGTSFRAPALYELYLGNQTNFGFSQASDPCRNWGLSTNPIIQQNCAIGRAGEGPLPDAFPVQPTSSATVYVNGGYGVLEAETADSFSAGLIWTPSFIDFSVALDYYKIEINNQVGRFGPAGIVASCYLSENFPDDPFCTLFTRAPSDHATRAYEILTINDSYVNIARQENEGMDLNVRYQRPFSFGDLTVNARASYILNWETQIFNDASPTILHDRIGNPRWVANLNARFDRGDWTFFWAADFVPATSNQHLYTSETGGYYNETVWTQREVDFYMTHDISVRRRFDEWTLQIGIQNLFNEEPSAVSTDCCGRSFGSGNLPRTSQYDFLGRRGFINIIRSW